MASSTRVVAPSQQRPARVAFNAALWAAWATNLVLFAVIAYWLCADGRAPRDPRHIWGGPPIAGFLSGHAAAALGGVSLALTLVGLLVGPTRLRGMRAWLLASSLFAMWCGLLAGWTEIHWRAQQARIAGQLQRVAAAMDNLREHWPTEDGDLPTLGPYLAYPKSGPTTLFFLGDASLPDTTLRVAAAEKTSDGAIRFEFTGIEPGVWLEQRPAGTTPRSFTSGLRTSYGVQRYARLTPGWFLVRYDARVAAQ